LRILANENIPGDAIMLLRQRGRDVVWIRTDSPGASDDASLARAVAQQRLLLTFDKDFGELVFHRGQKASCGIVLLRFSMSSSSLAAIRIADIIESRTDWSGQFSVVDEHRIRITPLPANR
jgi:predicted nuclease of predicted toxin-antitoxin system